MNLEDFDSYIINQNKGYYCLIEVMKKKDSKGNVFCMVSKSNDEYNTREVRVDVYTNDDIENFKKNHIDLDEEEMFDIFGRIPALLQ